MSPLLPYATLLALLAQDAPPADRGPQGRVLNRVEFVVNGEVVTRDQLQRAMRSAQERRPVTTPEERQALQHQIVMGRVQELLLVQAGEDMGGEAEAVERMVDDWWDHLIERAGGVREYSESLERNEQDSLRQRQQLTEELYLYSYQRVVTGQEPGPEGRPYVDRHLRPGTIRRVYDDMVRNGRALEEIGGQSRTFVFQLLVLGVDQEDELEPKYRQAKDLHARAVGGEDFNALVDAYSDLSGNRSVETGMQMGKLDVLGDEVFRWARTAEAEAISPVHPVRDPQTLGIVGWRILRVMEVRPAVVPPFEALETQMRIEAMLARRRDERLTSLALQDLFEVAYIHPDRERTGEVIDERLQRASQRPGSEEPAPEAPAGEADGGG